MGIVVHENMKIERGKANVRMRRMLIWAAALIMLCASAWAEEWPALPWDGPAPYGPVAGALSEDGLSYDDGTLSVRIEKDFLYDTNVYFVYVTITDPTQLRTAVAGSPKGKTEREPARLAEENNAVLAVNGDFYTYPESRPGPIVRNGEIIRDFNPKSVYDPLFIDDKGDLTPVSWPTDFKADRKFREYAQELIDAYNAEHTMIHSFTFGPALIIDGQPTEFAYRKKVSCGYPTADERMAFCQLGELSYLFVACEGTQQDDGKQPGLTGPQLTELCAAKGAVQAYNLDGGNSVAIYLCGQRINGYNINKSLSKERAIRDIIYFATLRPE